MVRVCFDFVYLLRRSWIASVCRLLLGSFFGFWGFVLGGFVVGASGCGFVLLDYVVAWFLLCLLLAWHLGTTFVFGLYD